jgi:hypothetical protein
MKDLKHIKRFNEAQENLNISDVSGSNLTMRQLMLDRIEQIKRVENGFSKSLMKWKQPLSHGTITKYAEEINFDELSDNDLLFLFERILRRHYTQEELIKFYSH